RTGYVRAKIAARPETASRQRGAHYIERFSRRSSTMHRLQNKTVLITGASAGIGRASALLFAREGAKLVLPARREDRLQSLANEIESFGGKAIILAGDVVNEAYAQALVSAAKDEFGGLDVAFLNAASMGELAPAETISEAGFEEALSVNVKGAYFGAK